MLNIREWGGRRKQKPRDACYGLMIGQATVSRDLSDPNESPESFVQASGREIAAEAEAKRDAAEKREIRRAEMLALL